MDVEYDLYVDGKKRGTLKIRLLPCGVGGIAVGGDVEVREPGQGFDMPVQQDLLGQILNLKGPTHE